MLHSVLAPFHVLYVIKWRHFCNSYSLYKNKNAQQCIYIRQSWPIDSNRKNQFKCTMHLQTENHNLLHSIVLPAQHSFSSLVQSRFAIDLFHKIPSKFVSEIGPLYVKEYLSLCAYLPNYQDFSISIENKLIKNIYICVCVRARAPKWVFIESLIFYKTRLAHWCNMMSINN